jgi:hypothetical protein
LVIDDGLGARTDGVHLLHVCNLHHLAHHLELVGTRTCIHQFASFRLV